MSDISLQLPWWFGPIAVLAQLFWPLLAASVACAILLWFKRSLLFVRLLGGVVFVLFAISSVVNIYIISDQAKSKSLMDADLRSRTRTLSQATTVAGIRLPAGTVVIRPDGGNENAIESLDLTNAADIHGVPVVGHVEFQGNGIHGDVKLARNVTIDEVPCSSSAPASFQDGRFIGCMLSRPNLVHGIPCRGVVDINVGVTCTLNAPIARFGYSWPAGTTIQDEGSGTTYFVMSDKTTVGFKANQLAEINPGTRGLSYRGCLVTFISIDHQKATGQLGRSCPLGSEGESISLPASAIPRAF